MLPSEVKAKLQELSRRQDEYRTHFETAIRAIEEGTVDDEILRKSARLQKELNRKYGELRRESESLVSYLKGLPSQLAKELGQLAEEVARQHQELERCEEKLDALEKSRQDLETRINRLQPGLGEWRDKLQAALGELKDLPVPPLPEEKYRLLRDIEEAVANIGKIQDTNSRLAVARLQKAKDKLKNARNLLSPVRGRLQHFGNPAGWPRIGDLQAQAERMQEQIEGDYEEFASSLRSAKKGADKVLPERWRKAQYVLYFLGLVVAGAFGYWLGSAYWM